MLTLEGFVAGSLNENEKILFSVTENCDDTCSNNHSKNNRNACALRMFMGGKLKIN